MDIESHGSCMYFPILNEERFRNPESSKEMNQTWKNHHPQMIHFINYYLFNRTVRQSIEDHVSWVIKCHCWFVPEYSLEKKALFPAVRAFGVPPFNFLWTFYISMIGSITIQCQLSNVDKFTPVQWMLRDRKFNKKKSQNFHLFFNSRCLMGLEY